MNDIDNLEMSNFWNGDGGKNWMLFQSWLEKSLKPFGKEAISSAFLKNGDRVLDVGCGWGETSFEISEKVSSSGHVWGVDISHLILNNAKTQADDLGYENVSFACVDAESYKFDSEVFDVIYSRFGVMFFNNPVNAFENLRYTLKPGGRLAFVCWQAIDKNQWVNLPLKTAQRHIRVVPASNPEAPGGFSFGSESRVRIILENAGFDHILVQPFEMKFTIGKNIEEALIFISKIGPVSTLLNDPELNNEIKNNITRDLRHAIAPFETSQGVQLGASTWIVTANKP